MTAIVTTSLPPDWPLENGSIIVVRPHEHPYILHFAVLIFDLGKWRIIHNNEENNVHLEDLESLLKRADYVTIQMTQLTGKSPSFLLERFKIFQGMQYDVVEYNCETFVNQFTYQKPVSSQAIVYTLLAAFWIFVILYFLWKQKLKSLL